MTKSRARGASDGAPAAFGGAPATLPAENTRNGLCGDPRGFANDNPPAPAGWQDGSNVR